MPHAKPSGDLVFPELTEDVVARIAATADARVREVMEMLIRHLHAFVREASLSHEEWRNAIEFLTQTGKMCSENRQEFILLSDILGVSMLVDAVNNSAGTGLTNSTVLGPFYAGRQRDLEPGDTILLRDEDGPPLIVEGTVTSQNGDPIRNALVEVWQTAQISSTTCKTTRSRRGICAPASEPTSAGLSASSQSCPSAIQFLTTGLRDNFSR